MGDIVANSDRDKILKATNEQLLWMLIHDLTLLATDIMAEIKYRQQEEC